MEIAGCEPFRIEDFLRPRAANRLEQQAFELIIGNAVLVARSDIVISVPKSRRHGRATNALEQSAGVLYGSPFEHTADGHMKHDGVVVFENSGIEDARLAERHPALDAGVGDDAFSLRFGEAVMVIRADADRVACSSPMERLAAVAHLSHTADIHHFRLVLLRQDSFHQILRCCDVCLARCCWTIIRLRRHHAAYMQHDIRTAHALQNIFIAREVAPNHFDILHQRTEFADILLTLAREYANNIVLFMGEQLLKAGPTHRTGSAGKKNGCLSHYLAFYCFRYCSVGMFSTPALRIAYVPARSRT